jgi:hypothetical protein
MRGRRRKKKRKTNMEDGMEDNVGSLIREKEEEEK